MRLKNSELKIVKNRIEGAFDIVGLSPKLIMDHADGGELMNVLFHAVNLGRAAKDFMAHVLELEERIKNSKRKGVLECQDESDTD